MVRYFLFGLVFATLVACESDDEKLTQADCERITDIATCGEKGCHWGHGSVVYAKCGEECHFPVNSTAFSLCLLSDTGIEENVFMTYHRLVGDTYEIVDLTSDIGNLTGWERLWPSCVTCTFDY